ncbi:uncharacterized protein [Rhodnius prolixus]|uniref:uncharacterized protein n=1 Tax=Rhodnius prolixus TaxID=13249 RepID=UPI003D18B954
MKTKVTYGKVILIIYNHAQPMMFWELILWGFFINCITLGVSKNMAFRNFFIDKLAFNKNESQDYSDQNNALYVFLKTVKKQYPNLLNKLHKEIKTLVPEEENEFAATNDTICDENPSNTTSIDFDEKNNSKLPITLEKVVNIEFENEVRTSTEISEYKSIEATFTRQKRKKIIENTLEGGDEKKISSVYTTKKSANFFDTRNRPKNKIQSYRANHTKKEEKLRSKYRKIRFSNNANRLEKRLKRKNIKNKGNILQSKINHLRKPTDHSNFQKQQCYKNFSVLNYYINETDANNSRWNKVIGTHQQQLGKNQRNLKNYILTD